MRRIPDDQLPTSGRLLRQGRDRSGLSVQEICDAITDTGYWDLGRSSIMQLERGIRTGSPELLVALCDLYGIDPIPVLVGYGHVLPAIENRLRSSIGDQRRVAELLNVPA